MLDVHLLLFAMFMPSTLFLIFLNGIWWLAAKPLVGSLSIPRPGVRQVALHWANGSLQGCHRHHQRCSWNWMCFQSARCIPRKTSMSTQILAEWSPFCQRLPLWAHPVWLSIKEVLRLAASIGTLAISGPPTVESGKKAQGQNMPKYAKHINKTYQNNMTAGNAYCIILHTAANKRQESCVPSVALFLPWHAMITPSESESLAGAVWELSIRQLITSFVTWDPVEFIDRHGRHGAEYHADLVLRPSNICPRKTPRWPGRCQVCAGIHDLLRRQRHHNLGTVKRLQSSNSCEKIRKSKSNPWEGKMKMGKQGKGESIESIMKTWESRNLRESMEENENEETWISEKRESGKKENEVLFGWIICKEKRKRWEECPWHILTLSGAESTTSRISQPKQPSQGTRRPICTGPNMGWTSMGEAPNIWISLDDALTR